MDTKGTRARFGLCSAQDQDFYFQDDGLQELEQSRH